MADEGTPRRIDAAEMAERLAAHRAALVAFLRRAGSGLLRFEDVEDLAQGVHVKALAGVSRYEHHGEEAFLGWLYTIARRHIADRHAHWKSLKRDAGPLLRITFGSHTKPEGGVAPAAGGAGPGTRAGHVEEADIATRALAALPERDAQIARIVAAGGEIEDVAERLGLSHAAAQRARLRALERFRKLVEIALA